MVGVIIGMDPHKRSATIEVTDERIRVLAAGRYRPPCSSSDHIEARTAQLP